MHSDSNAYPGIILHDCVVSNVKTAVDLLSFSFSYGFWITTHHRQNPYGKVLRTSAAELSYCNPALSELRIYLFEQDRKSGKTIRKEITFPELSENVNSGRWKWELVEEFYNCGNAMLIGYVKANAAPIEVAFQLSYKQAIYHWNEMLEDREW